LIAHNRQAYKIFEHKHKLIACITKNKILKSDIKWFYYTVHNKTLALHTRSKSVNNCIISGRSAGVYSFARIARTFIRDAVLAGRIPGLRKSYW
jgi:ribosomal protein S14